MGFQKTVILAIDSHGFYLIQNDKIYETISISDMNTNSSIKNVYKINSVIPGVKNVSTKKIRNKTMKKIQSFIQNSNIENLDLNEKTLDNFVMQLRDILMDCNNGLIPILIIPAL